MWSDGCLMTDMLENDVGSREVNIGSLFTLQYCYKVAQVLDDGSREVNIRSLVTMIYGHNVA